MKQQLWYPNLLLRRTLALALLCLPLSANAGIGRTYPLPSPDIELVGENIITTSAAEDTLIDLAVRYQLGYNMIRSANPQVDAWLPGDGTPVLLPYNTILPDVPRKGIVINSAEMRLYYFSQDRQTKTPTVTVYPISVGRGEWATPLTQTKITGKVKNPDWYPPETIRAEHAERGDILPKKVPAGPNNPLGESLLRLGIPSYFIHGTNKEFGIGMQVTHGCIRMYPQDIKELMGAVPVNTPVTIINQTYKIGWRDNQLYLEVHPPLEMADHTPVNSPFEITDAVILATERHPDVVVNWEVMEQVIAEARGIPIQVGYVNQPLGSTESYSLE